LMQWASNQGVGGSRAEERANLFIKETCNVQI
jgi:hypothetical protein